MRPLEVEIIRTPSCPHGHAVRRRIDALASGEGIEVVVTETLLDDLQGAAAQAFRGSPTILVNGQDVEPRASGAPADYGLG